MSLLWASLPVAAEHGRSRLWWIVQQVARARLRWTRAYSGWQGKTEAMASLIRRQLILTSAPIFKSRSRTVAQVAAAS